MPGFQLADLVSLVCCCVCWLSIRLEHNRATLNVISNTCVFPALCETDAASAH